MSEYYELNVRHQISYDDGDCEIIPLWAPTQMVKLLNKKKDFPAEHSRLLSEQKASAQADARHQEALLNVRTLLMHVLLVTVSLS